MIIKLKRQERCCLGRTQKRRDKAAQRLQKSKGSKTQQELESKPLRAAVYTQPYKFRKPCTIEEICYLKTAALSFQSNSALSVCLKNEKESFFSLFNDKTKTRRRPDAERFSAGDGEYDSHGEEKTLRKMGQKYNMLKGSHVSPREIFLSMMSSKPNRSFLMYKD